MRQESRDRTGTTDGPIEVDFWFDPVCPFAWATSRWILEVEKVRPVIVRFHVMSLGVLNHRGGGIPVGDEVELWAPVRVAIAAEQRFGPDILGPLYTAMGERRHHQRTESMFDVVDGALADLDLPAELAAAGLSTEFDQLLRASHLAGMAPVGSDVGTPVLHVTQPATSDSHGERVRTAFFGPVITRVPRGERAGELFDATVTLAGFKYFFELKRSRTEDPQFD